MAGLGGRGLELYQRQFWKICDRCILTEELKKYTIFGMLPMGLRFTVCWAFGNERCPTLDYLEVLKAEDVDCFYAVVDGIEKIQDSEYLREPTVKPLPVSKQVRDLFELRIQGGKSRHYARIALIYTKAREVVLLNGVTKKSKRATPQFTAKAVRLMRQVRSQEMNYEPIPIEQIRESLE